MTRSSLAFAAAVSCGCAALLDFDPATRPLRDAGAVAVDAPVVVDAPGVADVPAVPDAPAVPDVPAVLDVPVADVRCPGSCPPGLSCVEGACMCAAGLRDCGEGRFPRCRRCCRASDCDDNNGCTTDRCDAEGRCAYTGCENGRSCCANACMSRCP